MLSAKGCLCSLSLLATCSVIYSEGHNLSSPPAMSMIGPLINSTRMLACDVASFSLARYQGSYDTGSPAARERLSSVCTDSGMVPVENGNDLPPSAQDDSGTREARTPSNTALAGA